jgi:glycogen synthase kinase 3 beta
MPNGREMPLLFNWTKEGESLSARSSYYNASVANHLSLLFIPLELSIRPDLIHRLVPKHAEAELLSRGIDVNNFTPVPLESLRVTLD